MCSKAPVLNLWVCQKTLLQTIGKHYIYIKIYNSTKVIVMN